MPVIKSCPDCKPHDPCEDHFRSSDDRDIRFCQHCGFEVYVDKNLCTICDREF